MTTRDDYKQMQKDIDTATKTLSVILTQLYETKKLDPRARLAHDHLRTAVRGCDDAYLLMAEILYG